MLIKILAPVNWRVNGVDEMAFGSAMSVFFYCLLKNNLEWVNSWKLQKFLMYDIWSDASLIYHKAMMQLKYYKLLDVPITCNESIITI